MLEWFLSSVVLAIGSLTLGGLRFHRKSLEHQRKLVESCGLKVVKMSSDTNPWMKIEARAGPVTVRIQDSNSRKNRYGLQIRALFEGLPGFSGVRIRRESYRPPGAREIEVGDVLFDGTFFVEGPTRLMSVLLDAETRGLLLDMDAGGGLEIRHSEIRVETHATRLTVILPLILDLTRRFSEEVDVAQRLTENARQDTAPGVRLRNMLLLAREFPELPATLEVLRAACSDPVPQIRLRAAMELGAEGHGILVEFAENTEGTVEDAHSALAISRLDRALPFDRTRAILGTALRKRRIQTARACLEVIGKSGEAEADDVLVKVLAVERGELATVAALALGTAGSTAAEPSLLLALQRENVAIRTAAATALGRVGSAAAVLPLKEAAERAERDKELSRAIRQAIAEIQSRLQGASPGQLSLAGAEAGQLSLPEAEAGQLSLATDPAGQLSLPPGEPGEKPVDRPV